MKTDEKSFPAIQNAFSYMEIPVHITSPLPGKDFTRNSDLLLIRTGNQLRYPIVFQLIDKISIY